MIKTRVFKRSLLAAVIAVTTTQAHAAGFQLNAQSATGLGRAFAGDAVIADNASVLSRNAAAMSLFDKTEFSIGLNTITTDISIKNVEYSNAFGSQSLDDASNGGTTPVPNIYIVHPINDKWAVGAGIYVNFGTTNEFDEGYGSGTGGGTIGPIFVPIPGADAFAGTTKVSSMNLALAASYRINEQWSIGGGLDVVIGSGELKRTTTLTTPLGDASSTLLDVDASGIGLGFNLGTVYELDKNNRWGLSYHYSPEVEADGDVSYAGTDYDHLKLALPSMVEFSGYNRIQDTDFAIHYSVQWIGWSVFDSLELSDGTSIKDYEWQDGWHYAIGGTWYVNQNWEARIGYMYDTSAQDKLTSISVPDSDRQWFSAGATYHFSENNSLDFGFTYLIGDDVDVDENLGGVAFVSATTRADAVLVGLQYSHRF